LLIVPLLSVNDHGMVMVLGFTSPQKASLGAAVAQLAAVEVACRCKLASAQKPKGLLVAVQPGSHVYTVIVDVVPPFEKSLTTSKSPSLCTPVKPVPPPTLLEPSPIASWKNQNPCCASPLLSRRSEPKNSTTHGLVESKGG